MPAKQLLFRDAARAKLLEGATALADAVRVTLGPRSKCVLIGRKWGRPLACDDGVTVAKEVELSDPEQDLGARMIREAAERTGELVGDGTSTSTILAAAVFAEGLRNIALRRAHARGDFNLLALVAPPRFLGLLRHRLDKQTARCVAACANKELTATDARDLPAQLSDVFAAAVRSKLAAETRR